MRNTLIASIIGLCASSQLAVTNAQTPQAATPDSSSDAMFIYSSGIDGLLVDPKDKALADALKMITARVGELPQELDEEDMPAPAIQLALDLLMGPMSLNAGMVPEDQLQNGPPFYAQFNFMPGDAAKVESLAGRFTAMLRNVGAPPAEPAANLPGMSMMDADGMPIFFGAMKPGGTPAFVLGLNRASAAAVKPDPAGLPNGVKPAMAFNLDAKKLQPVLEMLMAQAGPDAGGAQMQLQMMGLYGPNASTINMVCGHGTDRSHFAMRYTNYRQILEQSKMLSDKRITADVLKRVPADASWACVSAFKLSGVGDMLANVAKQAAAQSDPDGEPIDPMAMVEQQTGINPQRDFFVHLGDYAGMYLSDTTGGGGFMSAVAFVEITNPDALSKTMTRITSMLNDIAQQQARGYVRIAQRTVNDVPMTILTFPGLPIPLEPCWALVDGWMYGAGSPQALLAGISQARTGKGNLADNPRFKEMGGASLDDAIQVSFMDTPKLIAGGYGLVSMGMAALANAVRSPSSDRDPGLIMPSFQKLTDGAKACVYVSRLKDNDMMMTGQSDRSVLVNACGAVSMLGGATTPIIIGALAGATLPALGKARTSAQELKSATQLRQVSIVMMMWEQEHNALPESIDALIEGDFLSREILDSPVGDASDGEGDYWINLEFTKSSEIESPDRQVLGYDRVMMDNGDRVAVVFFDGHTETMSVDDFMDLIADDPNSETDFNLP